MYTLSEFKKNIRKAFNAAETGEVVVIERFGVPYRLVKISVAQSNFEENRQNVPKISKVPLVSPAHSDDSIKLVEGGTVKKIIKTPKDVQKVLRPPQTDDVCPNGHLLQPGRDRCSAKGCKYSK